MSEITRCPKRVEEGGLIGTLDLGECLCNCAAFSSNWEKKRMFSQTIGIEIEYYQGRCDEYKRGVVARVQP